MCTTDVDLIRRMLVSGAMDEASWLSMLAFIAEQIASLEAPARNAETRAWVSAAATALTQACADAATGAPAPPTSSEPTSSGPETSPALVREVLPKVFAWTFFKLEQVHVDVCNAHLGVLAPYLHNNDQGVQYERSHFERARAEKRVGLQRTLLWLKDTSASIVDALSTAAAPPATPVRAAAEDGSSESVEPSSVAVVTALEAFRRDLHRDSQECRLVVLREGLLRLLVLQQPLTVLAAAAGQSDAAVTSTDGTAGAQTTPVFPEVFRLDAQRLTDVQNVLQRCALVSVLSSLMGQV